MLHPSSRQWSRSHVSASKQIGEVHLYALTDCSSVSMTFPGPAVDTEGGDSVTVTGLNMGPAPRNTSRVDLRLASDVFLPSGLPLSEAPALPTAFLVLVFHRSCISMARDVRGVRPETRIGLWYASTTVDACASSIGAIGQTGVTFGSAPGIGRGRTVQVLVVDPVDGVIQQSLPAVVSYKAPEIQSFSPSVVSMEGITAGIDVLGRYFGNEELASTQGWTAEERALTGKVGGMDCTSTKRRRENGETVLTCDLDQRQSLAGYRNVTVTVAGQLGIRDATPSGRTLLLGEVSIGSLL